MGDRISIQFKNGDDMSPIICSHWGGKSFLNTVLEYTKTLRTEMQGKSIDPLNRLEI